LSDGSVVWEKEGRGKVIAAPVVGDGVLAFGLMGPSALRPPKIDYLVALDPATGEQKWAVNDSYSVLGTPLIGGGRVFFITVEGYVSKTVARAADLSTGELVWERPVGGVVDSSPALIGVTEGADGDLSDAILCFGCHDGRLYLLNAATGAVSGVESLDTKVYSSPAIADGRIYIGANDGRLHCLSSAQ
jgi:outer membrane protein assembly factor BamB